MANKPVFGAYDITFTTKGQDAQHALEKGLSGIKSTLRSFDNFFDPLVKEVDRTAETITIRAYAAEKNLKQLESKLLELRRRLALPTGIRDEMGNELRDPAITSIASAGPVNVDRGRVYIHNDRDAAAMRARAASANYSIQKDPTGAPGSYFMNAPAGQAGYYRRDIRKLNAGAYAAEAAQKQVEEQELIKKQAEAERKKADKEAERERKRADAQRERNANSRSPLTAALGMLGLGIKLTGITVFLNELVKFTKMIYGLVAESMSKARNDVLVSGATGITATKLRQYSAFEEAKGLASGTYNASFGSVISKFSNVTKLDQGALESLALVMGPGIKDLIMSGMGGKNPDELLGKILNSFTERALSGKNSVGMDVGVSDAVTELTEYLRKIDPNWASIFSIKVAESLSPVLTNEQRAKAARGGLMWDTGVSTNAFNMTELDAAWLNDMKNNADEMKNLLGQLKDAIGRWLAPIASMLTELTKAVVLKFGDPRQKQKIFDENMREAQARLEENTFQKGRVDNLLAAKRSEMKNKFGIELTSREEVMMNNGIVLPKLSGYEPKDRDDAKEFMKALAEYRILSATSGRLAGSLSSLRKEADPNNTSPSDTSIFSYERLASLALSDAIAGQEKFIRLETKPGGIAGSKYSDYITRGIVAAQANFTEALSNKDYLVGKTAELYQSLSRADQSKVVNVDLHNKDNTLTIELVDADGRVVGSRTTQVGIPTEGVAFGIDDLGLNNAVPTNSAGEPGSPKAMKHAPQISAGGDYRNWKNPSGK